MAKRGLVVGPIMSSDADSFSVDLGVDLGVVRRALLYWDELVYPEVNGVAPNLEVLPELKSLVDGSILTLEPVIIDGSTLPDDGSPFGLVGIPSRFLPHAYTLAQIEVVRSRSSIDGIWTFAQSGSGLRLPPLPAQDATLVEYQLSSCLPVPSRDTTIDAILDFREKYKSDLLRFRGAIEALRGRILESPEPRRALTAALEEIEIGAAEVQSHMRKVGMRNALEMLKGVLNVKQSALITAAVTAAATPFFGVAVAAQLGAPVGLAANASITLIQRLIVGGQQIPKELEGFAYVFRAEKEFDT